METISVRSRRPALREKKARKAEIVQIGDIAGNAEIMKELAAARDAALVSVRQKSEFLANMSHEIRTPMNGVIGLLGVLLDSELNADQRDLAETARSSAELLLQIINDVLDFSKIEAGKLNFEVLDFEIRTTIDSVMDIFSDSARKKGLEIGCVVDAEIPRMVRGDPGRLRQVLLNLTSNALKFTEEGGVVVQIEMDSQTDDAVVLRCRVTDSGIGIPSETRDQLFQPFMQGESSTTRRFGGTGLGLAISKQLVQMMDGQIGVESEPGCGSSFWFTARFARCESPALAIVPATNSGTSRVLLVDDNPTTRQIVALQLTAWGVPNDTADSTFAALAMLRDAAVSGQPFDLVISDLNMPGADGITLARFIQADPSFAQPRFVLMTASTPGFDAAKLSDLGVSACLRKPMKPQHLFQAVFQLRPAEPVRPSQQPHGPTLSTANAKARILVVDDNAVNQKVAVRQLQKLGYAADSVGNGLEAVEALERISYDAVLMDCQMPEMDGYEATSEIRRREKIRGGHTPIIAATASASEADRDRCIAAGMDDFVTKPMREQELIAALQRNLPLIRDAELTH